MRYKIKLLIHSYNDEELLPTIEDAIARQSGENDISFKVTVNGYGYDIGDELNRIDNLEYIELQGNFGVGRDRKILTSDLPEDIFTLQLDAHHRFNQDWDKQLIADYNSLKNSYDKIVISTYLPPYDEKGNYNEHCEMKFFRFNERGIPLFVSHPTKKSLEETLFISAHFLFTTSSFYREVQYQDYYYFFGEEIMLSIAAGNAGYKVFIPSKLIAYHHYSDKRAVNRDRDRAIRYENFIKTKIDTDVSLDFISKAGIDFINCVKLR